MTERIAFYPGSGQISYEHLKKGFESSFKPKMPVAFKPRPSEKGMWSSVAAWTEISGGSSGIAAH
jgi:hypothetical protein